MLQDATGTLDKLETAPPPPSRVGDLSAMLRVMGPLNGCLPGPAGQRRLLADLCRFIGVQVGSVSMESIALPRAADPVPSQVSPLVPPPLQPPIDPAIGEMSPRLEQTLRHLLDGDSEKQVARKLSLSPHTVHVYVKALYRKFGVSTRAELLSKQLRR